ncbi:hypothetical protein E1A91_D13G109600v1 [Gossypium mustelinum]|nr:hypothetical protein E1A91_D13G109600v1 [Gossypium mustelinum]
MMPQHHVKEQSNALVMNKKIMSILAERDAAIQERNIAISERKEALAARDEALQQRDKALAERDSALIERDNALAVLQCRESAKNFPFGSGIQRGRTCMHPSYHSSDTDETLNHEMHVTDALPVSTIPSAEGKSCPVKRTKVNRAVSSKSPRKIKKVAEDLNRQVDTEFAPAQEFPDIATSGEMVDGSHLVALPAYHHTHCHRCQTSGTPEWVGVR